MKEYSPDWRNIVNATRNIETAIIPLYEHSVGVGNMERVLGEEIDSLFHGDRADKVEYVRRIARFYKKVGYDFFNYERGIGQILPGGGALGNHVDPVIKTMDDFNKYPWEQIPEIYFKSHQSYYEVLEEGIPNGMLALGGPGNGIFESVQELTGFEGLCYIKEDDPELYEKLFRMIGKVSYKIWEEFLRKYGSNYCVFRFGDDLGFKSATLLAPDDIKKYIIPEYAKIIKLIHSTGKPFMYHSCGQITAVMDEIISVAKIDAKHSNEDEIAPFWFWVEEYGDRIGNFGGIDTDVICRADKATMKDYITEVVAKSKGHGGFAFGSGNSIPDYVPTENYLYMNEIIRELRGEFKA